MPHIATYTTCPISDTQETILKTRLGEAITCLNGKTERYLMLSFHGQEHLWFGGDNAPAALLEVDVFGSLDHADCEKLTARLCEIVDEVLSIPADRVYVRYSSTKEWGWNGVQF